MGTIYKITNQINGKIYIGKTMRSPQIRWQEHIQYSNQPARYNTPLYLAMRKYGVNNFKFEILVTEINNIEILNQLEQEFIQAYASNSHKNGYNVAIGGDGGRVYSKLTESQVQEIYQILQDNNNIMSFNEIGELFNISGSVIQSINTGTSWFSPLYNYPLRKYSTIGLTITRQEYQKIILDIQNQQLSLADIAQKYNLSEGKMTAINQGKECYNKEGYYKGIYNGDFPIRKDNRTFSSKEDLIPVFYDVLFTRDSMAKIGARHGIEGNTIQCITTGRRRKELTQDFILPMRKHIEDNQEIFLTLYPEYRKGDAQ